MFFKTVDFKTNVLLEEAYLKYMAPARQELEYGIPWDAIAKTPVSDSLAQDLNMAAAVEQAVEKYVLMAGVSRYEPIQKFSAQWCQEEPRHGFALEKFLEVAGKPLVPYTELSRSFAFRTRARIGIAGAQLLRKLCGTNFDAYYLLVGLSNELATGTFYQVLKERHPVLAILLDRIGKEERLHVSFYAQASEIILNQEGLGKLHTWFRRVFVPKLLAYSFEPVGASLIPDMVRRTIRSLLKEAGPKESLMDNLGRLEMVRGIDGKVLKDQIYQAIVSY